MLIDIPSAEVVVGKTPTPPEGYEIAHVDVVVRLRRKALIALVRDSFRHSRHTVRPSAGPMHRPCAEH